MPPQGESTGICIEDAIIFSRALMHHNERDLASIFASYEKVRRKTIDEAYDQAVARWEVVKDSGWLVYKIKSGLKSTRYVNTLGASEHAQYNE